MVAAGAFLAAACTGGGDDGSVGATPVIAPTAQASSPATTTAPETGDLLAVPPQLAGFPIGSIRMGEQAWTVAVADTSELRVRGLRLVADLGDLDGMLFVFPADATSAFTMRDTEMPIDIAFFAASGELVDRLDMVPCRAEPCPTYGASAPFRYAVETDHGGFDGVELVLDPGDW